MMEATFTQGELVCEAKAAWGAVGDHEGNAPGLVHPGGVKGRATAPHPTAKPSPPTRGARS